MPPPMKNALRKALSKSGYIRDSDYILGPLYERGDLQIGVTGGVAMQEPTWIAASRELGEEIGLVPRSKENLHKLHKGIYPSRRGYKDMRVYDLFMSDCLPVLDHQHGAKVTTRQDDKNLKVGVYVYGTRQQIYKYLCTSAIYVYHSSDDIVGVGAIRAKDALKLLT